MLKHCKDKIINNFANDTIDVNIAFAIKLEIRQQMVKNIN